METSVLHDMQAAVIGSASACARLQSTCGDCGTAPCPCGCMVLMIALCSGMCSWLQHDSEACAAQMFYKSAWVEYRPVGVVSSLCVLPDGCVQNAIALHHLPGPVSCRHQKVYASCAERTTIATEQLPEAEDSLRTGKGRHLTPGLCRWAPLCPGTTPFTTSSTR